MKSDLFEFIGQARRPRSAKFRVQVSIFLICLALSFLLWLLVKLSKDYYYAVPFRINFKEVPDTYRLMAKSDSTLVLRIKLQGFDLFSEHFLTARDRTYDLSLKHLRINPSGDVYKGFLPTAQIGREIISQSTFPNELFYVTPDTLFFVFEKEPEPTAPVIPSPETVTEAVTGADSSLPVHDSAAVEKENGTIPIQQHP